MIIELRFVEIYFLKRDLIQYYPQITALCPIYWKEHDGVAMRPQETEAQPSLCPRSLPRM